MVDRRCRSRRRHSTWMLGTGGDRMKLRPGQQQRTGLFDAVDAGGFFYGAVAGEEELDGVKISVEFGKGGGRTSRIVEEVKQSF